LREGARTVACIEEDSLALELDQCGETPVLPQSGGPAERIVKDDNPVRTHGVSFLVAAVLLVANSVISGTLSAISPL
jgi:hypothetical protein